MRRASRLVLIAALGGLFVSCPEVALSADTDLVVLANGNRLLGEVKRLDHGRLELSTTSMSTVYVEWDKVVEIQAVGEFEVETSDGRRYLGMVGAGGPGKLVLTRAADSTHLDLGTIVRMVPIHESFLRRLSGSVDLGFGYTKASGVAQLNVASETTFRRPAYQVSLSFTENYTRQADAPDSNRNSLNFGHTRFLSHAWFLLTQGIVEQNRDLGFDVRGTAAYGVGRQLVKTNRSLFGVMGGLAVTRELPVAGDAATNADAVLGLNSSYFTYDYPKTNATVSLAVFPGLIDWGRVRMNLSGNLKRELIRDFFLVVSGYDSFDNRPPTSDAVTNDVGVSISVGWTFGR